MSIELCNKKLGPYSLYVTHNFIFSEFMCDL